MEIYCDKCHASIPTKNIDIKDKIGKCDECNNIFNIKSQINVLLTKERSKIELPKNLKIEKHRTSMLIIRTWFGPAIIFLTLFCVIWDGIVGTFIIALLIKGQYAPLLFLSIHGTIGLVITYFTIAGYINKTFIDVDSSNIKITHRPLPWPGQKSISLEKISQLYSKKKMYHTKNGVHYKYEIHIIRENNKDEILINNLEKEEQALFIEQEIESFLKIEDRAVEGEIDRG